MASDILVDSNVFIDLIRFRGDPAPWLHRWAGPRDLAICGMVRLEVLRGVRSPKAHRSLSAFMDAMVNIPAGAGLWEDAAALAWNLDRRGKVIPGTDVVIAASALSRGAALLTSDAHFDGIEGLAVIRPPDEWFA